MVRRQVAKASKRKRTDKDIVYTLPSCYAKSLEEHTCEDDTEFLPPLCAPEASIESQEKKRTKVGYKQDWSPVTEIMVRYDISAEAGQELLKGFAKVTGTKITSYPPKRYSIHQKQKQFATEETLQLK